MRVSNYLVILCDYSEIMVQSVVDLVHAKPRSFENVEKVSDSNFHVPFLHPNAPEAKEIQKTINGVIDQSFKIVPVFKGE